MHIETSLSGGTPLLAQVLGDLNREALLPVKEIERVLVLAGRSGYAYLNGSDLSFSQFYSLFQNCFPRDPARRERIQNTLLNALTDGTPWLHEHLDANSDLTGDGIIDTDDILKGAIDANAHIAGLLEQAHIQTTQSKRSLSEEQALKLKKAINQTLSRLVAVRQAVDFLSNHSSRRSA